MPLPTTRRKPSSIHTQHSSSPSPYKSRLFCLLALSLLTCAREEIEIDGHYEETTLTRLAFGSCNKQWRNNTLWEPIVAFQPQAYLWLGDAVYVKEHEGDNQANLRKAYQRQLRSPGYQKLLASGAVIEGVYDDHDMSTNDGHRVNYTPQRQTAYLDFLGHIAADSPRRARKGLYSSHLFGLAPRQAKVLFLDVRSLSDDPAWLLPPRIADLIWPIKPYLLALVRWAAVMFGGTQRYEGDVLGQEQWEWLEAQLAQSEASLHLIVSSIQVLSINPIVEGWGHYPKAQARLLALLRKYQPRGLVLLSGDVHFAELLTTTPTATEGGEGEGEETKLEKATEPLEVTSSGMTHTCFATAMGMCQMAVQRYDRHRFTPESYYGGKNYGTVEVDWDAGEALVRVRDKKGLPVLETRRRLEEDAAPLPIGEAYSFSDNQDHYFFLFALCFVAVLAWGAFVLVRWVFRTGKEKHAKSSNGRKNGSTNGKSTKQA